MYGPQATVKGLQTPTVNVSRNEGNLRTYPCCNISKWSLTQGLNPESIISTWQFVSN